MELRKMETDITGMNSTDLYSRFIAERNAGNAADGKPAALLLAETIKNELCTQGRSSLLDTAVYSLVHDDPRFSYGIQEFTTFSLDLNKSLPLISHSDAALLVRCLANTVSGGQIRKNEIYDAWYENFGLYGLDISMSFERTVYLLQMTDRYLADTVSRPQTEKIIPISDGHIEKQESETGEQPEEKELPADTSAMDAEEAQSILASAEEKAKQIIENAERKADRIKAEAQELYNVRKAEADRRICGMKITDNKKDYENRYEEITSSFREIRKLLNDAGIELNQLDQKINTDHIRKIFRQYSELYHLINDVTQSISLKDLSENDAMQRIYQNHLIYLDIIEENLSEFGIEPLISSPRDSFDSRIHQTDGHHTFKHGTAHVKNSLRHGFVYGNTVLEKELVELEEER